VMQIKALNTRACLTFLYETLCINPRMVNLKRVRKLLLPNLKNLKLPPWFRSVPVFSYFFLNVNFIGTPLNPNDFLNLFSRYRL
jgi:hypothetical protein